MHGIPTRLLVPGIHGNARWPFDSNLCKGDSDGGFLKSCISSSPRLDGVRIRWLRLLVVSGIACGTLHITSYVTLAPFAEVEVSLHGVRTGDGTRVNDGHGNEGLRQKNAQVIVAS